MTEKQEQIFFEIHTDIPREGPGSLESTQTAFSMLKGLPEEPFILDVGCGPGKQTFDLAAISDAKIIALDNHKPYLDIIDREVEKLDLSNRISTKQGDMNDLPFDENMFDIIWAEGSIYLMGFGKALGVWKKYLKENGYIVFSELCWFKNERPEEIENFWHSFYGPMQTVESIVKFLTNSEYKFIGSYVLPSEDWWGDYYSHIQEKIKAMQEKYAGDDEVLDVINMELTEMQMHKKYSDYYGYSFFVVEKVE